MEDPVIAEVPSELAEGFLGGVKTRKEKRKALKKLKRKQIRKEAAIREREEEEAWSNDPEEQLKIRLKEQEAAEIADRERKEFEERERLWIEAAAKRKAEEEERKKKLLEESQMEKNQQTDHANELEEGDGWDYVEEGPAEIIWQGNEIIVKKKRVKVAKISADRPPDEEDDDRPTSNPLPPQSAAFASYKNGQSVTAQEMLESVAQQVPNFGTEQDKAHCPFHLKTAACRFGSRCSRVHFYPDKSCTLLIKNMYNGPGLAWEQDEGLEYTDEEVERCYEEFYEDVHTEFLKFGELVNFKVCKNGSYHLRGNLYVHYKSLDSAILAYNTMNGRYFAGKQITCEFVSVTRWKVAICGEYMKSRLKNCSHGTACNFIHCFRNPGGDYEWADWDDPPPKYWIEKMVVLFGPSDESGYGKQMELEDWERRRDTSRKETPIHSRRYWSRRSTYGKMEGHDSGSGREDSDRKRDRCSSHSVRREHSSRRRKETSFLDKHEQSEENHKSKVHGYNTKYCSYGHDSDEDSSKEKDREFLKKHQKIEEKNSFQGHERHTEKNRTIEDLSRWEKGEAFYVEQEKSVRKHKSKSRKRHGEGHRSSDHISDYTDDNRERSYSRSSEESYSRHSIDAQDRYNGRYCSDDSDSRRDFSHESRSQHSKQANEKRETDQYNSEHQTSHTCYENEQIGRKGKLRTQEGSNQRFSSAESSGGWETTYSDSGWEENYDRSLCNGSGRYHRKHSTSGGNGKHLREKREHEVSNLGSDEELDMRAYKKHSRSQTSTRCSGSLKRERNQRSSHGL